MRTVASCDRDVTCRGVDKQRLTTAEVAKRLGMTRAALQAWIGRGIVIPPVITYRGKREVRLWTERQVEAARAVKRERDGIRASMKRAHERSEQDKRNRKAARDAKRIARTRRIQG